MKNIILAVSLLIFSGCGYNAIQGLDEEVSASWAEVQNQYKRRADLIPQLISVVDGVKKYEKETLEAVVKARAEATKVNLTTDDLTDPKKFKAFQKAQSALGSSLSRLLMTVERYPELKATENFKALQAQLEGTENRIAVARQRYIKSVSAYNKKIRFFPSNLTAKYILDAKVKQQFTPDPSEQVEKVPEIKFSE